MQLSGSRALYPKRILLIRKYDSRDKVLRLSPDVYQGRTLAAVGIAAHESGHALQDAQAYAPLVVRNAAVPAASFGSGSGIGMIIFGFILHLTALAWVGVGLFACVVFFQLVNLPVEFNASSRAKQQLVQLGIINQDELVYVNKVLNAAAWTYVAATLQSVMILLYYVTRLNDRRTKGLATAADACGDNVWPTYRSHFRARGCAQRQPGAVVGAAGDALLDEVHPFDAVVDVRIDRVVCVELLARGPQRPCCRRRSDRRWQRPRRRPRDVRWASGRRLCPRRS